MGITETERVSRRDSIGASDVPAILNISPFRTPSDVYLEKTTLLDDADLSDSMAIRVGETMELSLVLYGCEQAFKPMLAHDIVLDKEVIFDHKVVGKTGSPKHANLDGMVLDKNTGKPCLVIEAKTTSVPEHWGPSGSQKIPAHVLAQVQFQMGLLGVDHAVVATLLSAFRLELRFYLIPFDKGLFDSICSTVDDFWFGFVEPRVKPEMSLPSRDTLNLIKRDQGKEIGISSEVYRDLVRAKTRMKEAKESLEDCQKAVISELDDCEVGVCPEGIVTYLEQDRKGYEVKPSSSRVLRLKKKKDTNEQR